MAGSAATWTAPLVAPTLDPADAGIVQALTLFEEKAWSLGGIFFGLWLIPMGWAAWHTGYFHAGKVLGGILMAGGVAYVLGAFASLVPGAAEAGVADLAAMPTTIGEFWTIFALLAVGVREPVSEDVSGTEVASSTAA